MLHINKSRKLLITLLLSVVFILNSFAQEKKDALQLYKQKDYSQAIIICENEIAAKPNNMDSYAVLCWSLVANKQYSEAELWATKALKIAPYDQRIIEILAEAKFHLGKNPESLLLFQEYISLVTPNASRVSNAYFYMAEIYVRQGKFQHADIAFSQSILVDPLNDLSFTRLGYVRERTKEYKLAALAYDEAMKLNKNNTDAIQGKMRVMEYIR